MRAHGTPAPDGAHSARLTSVHGSDLDDSDPGIAQRGKILWIRGEDGDWSGCCEGSGTEHGVDGVLVAMQARVGKQDGGVTGDGLGDGFDDNAGQSPLQGRAVDPGMDDLDEGGRTGDHAEVVAPRWPTREDFTGPGSGSTGEVVATLVEPAGKMGRTMSWLRCWRRPGAKERARDPDAAAPYEGSGRTRRQP